MVVKLALLVKWLRVADLRRHRIEQWANSNLHQYITFRIVGFNTDLHALDVDSHPWYVQGSLATIRVNNANCKKMMVEKPLHMSDQPKFQPINYRT